MRLTRRNYSVVSSLTSFILLTILTLFYTVVGAFLPPPTFNFFVINFYKNEIFILNKFEFEPNLTTNNS